MEGINKPESGRPVGVSGKELGAFGAACGCIPRSLRGCFHRLLTPDAKVRSLEKFILGGFDASQSKVQFDVGSCLRPRTPRHVIPGPRPSKGDLHEHDSLLAGHETIQDTTLMHLSQKR
jgi:hypothetical protein